MPSERNIRYYGEDYQRTEPVETQDAPRVASVWTPGPRDQIEQALTRAAVRCGFTLGGAQWEDFLATAAREIVAGGKPHRRRIGETNPREW